MNRKANTIFLAILTCFIWSSVYALIKLGLKYDTPFCFAAKRFIIAGLMVIPFSGRLSCYLKIIRIYPGIIIKVTLLQVIINYVLFYLGMNLVPGAIGAVIVGSQPLVTALVAAWMIEDDNITKRKIITIIAGIAGVVLISAGRQALKLGTSAELLGIILIMGANIATSVSNVIVSTRSKGINPMVMNSFSLLIGGIFIYLLAIPLETVKPLDSYPLKYWLILISLSFVSAYTFSIWYKLLQRPEVKVSELNLWKFIIPVFGAIISWLVVSEEKPDILTIAGIIIISLSLLLFFSGIKGISFDRALNK